MCYRYSPFQTIFNIKSHCDIINNHTKNKISVDDDERSGFSSVEIVILIDILRVKCDFTM